MHVRLKQSPRMHSDCLRRAEERGHGTAVCGRNDRRCSLQRRLIFPQAVRAYQESPENVSGFSLCWKANWASAIIRADRSDKGLERIRHSVERQPQLQGELHDRLILSLVWLNRTSRGRACCGEQIARRSIAHADGFPARRDTLDEAKQLGKGRCGAARGAAGVIPGNAALTDRPCRRFVPNKVPERRS